MSLRYSISDWSSNQDRTGDHCAHMLTHYHWAKEDRWAEKSNTLIFPQTVAFSAWPHKTQPWAQKSTLGKVQDLLLFRKFSRQLYCISCLSFCGQISNELQIFGLNYRFHVFSLSVQKSPAVGRAILMGLFLEGKGIFLCEWTIISMVMCRPWIWRWFLALKICDSIYIH